MVVINPYINFNGNAEEAFGFYRSVFGGEISEIIRFKEISSPEFPVAEKFFHLFGIVGRVDQSVDASCSLPRTFLALETRQLASYRQV